MSKMRLLSWIPLVIALAVAGSASALEVRSPGDPPTLVVQVPDSAVVLGEKRNTVFLVQGRLPYLYLNVESGDVTKLMAGDRSALDAVATNFVNGVAQNAQTVTPAVAAGQTTLAGRPAWLYRFTATNKNGVRADFEVWILPIDAGRVGFIGLAGTAGEAGTALLEQAVSRLTLSAR